jgi:hypothetical protein
MLRLLLDEHISPSVGTGLRRRHGDLEIYPLAQWEKGRLLGQDDVTCLHQAAEQGLTLVTYDRRTIPILLKNWAEEARVHGGVIFVDEKTISPADIGGLVSALTSLVNETGDWDWTNRIYFLHR